MEALFCMLGFCLPRQKTSVTFKTLGLLISFEHRDAGFFNSEHTDARRKEVLQTLEHLIARDVQYKHIGPTTLHTKGLKGDLKGNFRWGFKGGLQGEASRGASTDTSIGTRITASTSTGTSSGSDGQ